MKTPRESVKPSEADKSQPAGKGRKGLFNRFLDRIEEAGNKLPDPVSVFLIIIACVVLASLGGNVLGLSVVHPGTGEDVRVVNLFSGDNIQRMLSEMPRTFAEFPPLGLVLVVMLGIGVADRSGLLSSVLQRFVQGTPPSLVTAAVIFTGIMSSLALDAGYVVVIPLGAVIFYGVGRHPLAGLAAAFAGVAGGFSANLLLTSIDPLLAGFTEPAARILDPGYSVNVAANWYLMIALVPVLVLAGWFVTARIVEPRLGAYEHTPDAEIGAALKEGITPLVRRGHRWAGVTALACFALCAFLVIPEDAPLRGEDGSLAPFYGSLVALIFFLFLLPGIAFGIATGKIKSDRDIVRMSTEAMAGMGAYIVLAFVAAHLIAFFNWSNLGLIVAVSGADLLKSIGFDGIPMIVSFVFLSATINLFVGSASAKWALMAPVFVPMLMLLGYSPELTQVSYRVGDSFTNILTPLMPYFPLVIIFARKYMKEMGLGTLISLMIPYSIAFGILSTLTLVLWILFGWPLGPDSPLTYP